MTVPNFGKRWFKTASGLSALLLTSCLTLGVSHVQDTPASFQLQTCQPDHSATSTVTQNNLTLSVRYMGPSQPLATAKTVFGTTTRYVIPYSRDTVLFELKAENQGTVSASIQTAGISLATDQANQALHPLDLAYFKRLWPTYAVRNTDQLLDQSTAIGEVIRTLFRDRTLAPGQTVSGILPFPSFTPGPSLTLSIPAIQTGTQQFEATFCFKVKAG